MKKIKKYNFIKKNKIILDFIEENGIELETDFMKNK